MSNALTTRTKISQTARVEHQLNLLKSATDLKHSNYMFSSKQVSAVDAAGRGYDAGQNVQ